MTTSASSQLATIFEDLDQLPTPVLDHDVNVAKLRGIGGRGVVLEMIAAGRLPAEIALYADVPQLWFKRWVDDEFRVDELMEAKGVSAEVFQLRAQVALSIGLDTPAQVASTKALAKQYVEMSRSLDPENWAVRRDIQGGLQAVNVSFSVPGGPSIGVSAAQVDGEVIDAGPTVSGVFDALDVEEVEPLSADQRRELDLIITTLVPIPSNPFTVLPDLHQAELLTR